MAPPASSPDPRTTRPEATAGSPGSTPHSLTANAVPQISPMGTAARGDSANPTTPKAGAMACSSGGMVNESLLRQPPTICVSPAARATTTQARSPQGTRTQRYASHKAQPSVARANTSHTSKSSGGYATGSMNCRPGTATTKTPVRAHAPRCNHRLRTSCVRIIGPGRRAGSPPGAAGSRPPPPADRGPPSCMPVGRLACICAAPDRGTP